MRKTPHGLLFDMVRCSGCRACVGACMRRHGFPGDPEGVTELSSTACTAMVERDDYPVRNLCRHCLHPTCVSVCPVGALKKTEVGAVVYDATRCIGCRYCMVACPFNIPRYEWDKTNPAVRKCDLCIERLQRGEPPACAEACPNSATIFGTRADLLEEARRRIAAEPDEYYDHIYGEHEIGGTSVLFLAPHPMESLGYAEILGDRPLPLLTLKVLRKIPSIVTGVGTALLAIWWITRRRDEVALAEGRPRGREASHGRS